MAMILTSPPAVEPVSLDEAKLYLRVDHDDEDTLISSLITAARVHVETSTGRALITQSWTLFADAWPDEAVLDLPLAPLQSLDEVRLIDADGGAEMLGPAAYFADTVSVPPRLVRQSGEAWPAPGQVANGIEIDFTAGYGASAAAVPQPLRQAVLSLVTHWFETRAPVVPGSDAQPVPISVDALIAPYRGARL